MYQVIDSLYPVQNQSILRNYIEKEKTQIQLDVYIKLRFNNKAVCFIFYR